MNRLTLLLAAALGASAASLFAQTVPPTVNSQIADITQYAGAPARSIDLTSVFSDPDVTDAVRFATDLGNLDIALLGGQKPITVANFLRYVDEGRYFKPDPNLNNQLAPSFVHRVYPGFIIEGGQWLSTVAPDGHLQPTALGVLAPIQNEAGISNKRGTIAMDQVGSDQNSATSEWFINLADNAGAPHNLDIRDCASTPNGQVCRGPYTVFGRIGNNTMSVADDIAAVPWYNFSGAHPSFEHLPLRDYMGGAVILNNIVAIPAISHIPVLNLSASSDNANAAVTINGTKLLVTGNNVGTAHITVTATDLDGASVSQQFTVNVLAAPGRPVNLSTRMQVGTGDNALIAGFIMRGAAAKRLAIRGIGPSTGLPNRLSNPTLELHDSTGATIATNDNWGTAPNKQDIIDLGLAPVSPNESVILTTVPSNANGVAYTAILRGVNNTTGLGVVEVYDVDSGPGSTLLNISTRGQVGADPNALIAGFIMGGTESKQLLIRAIGPSLAAFGISNTLVDPTLELRNQNGGLIDSNDDWGSSAQKAQIQSSGLAPTNAKESAVLQTLAAGQYTALVHGANGGTGIGSVEVYQLP